MERKPLSKRLRFNVFKRDSFCCQYCGNHPPSVVLEVDHIIPASKGGNDSIDNLITSCFDCNRGKSNIELTELPEKTQQKVLLIKERELQYKEYQKLLKSINQRLEQECEMVADIFSDFFTDRELTKSFKNGSVKRFLTELGYWDVSNAMQFACARISKPSDATKYFCGICWNKIKEKQK